MEDVQIVNIDICLHEKEESVSVNGNSFDNYDDALLFLEQMISEIADS